MSLADIIAKQKLAKAAATAPAPVATPTPTPAPSGGLKIGLKIGAKPAVAPAPEKPVENRLTSGLNILLNQKPAVVESEPQVEGMTLDSLADMDISDINEQSTPHPLHTFDDEIPCTAPERDLPEDLTEGQRQFVAQIDSIYEIMHDPELFGNMVKIIMQEMNENPDYVNLMADDDVHALIRGLRSSMGLAKIKKAEKSVKGRAAKKATPATAMAGTLDELFNSEDF